MRTRFLPLLPVLLALPGCHFYEEHVATTTATPGPAAPAGPVSLHLATFRQAYQKDDSWFRITRDYPEIGQYAPRIVAVPDLPFTRIYELHVDGVPGPQAASLCATMMAEGQYCAIEVPPPPPSDVGITTETTTTVAPAPAPPVGTAPLP